MKSILKYKLVLIVSIFLSLFYGCIDKTTMTKTQNIKFEISDYNLLFTEVEIGDKVYTALIDFGDFAEFQISTKLIAELGLRTKESDILMSDINGEQYALEKGIIKKLKIGGKIEEDVTFYSANNEIDAVSQEVGTNFQVVVGFGYFKSKDFKLNFVTKNIDFLNSRGSETNFTFPINTNLDHLIGKFSTITNESVDLLFDTGTPISRIDTNLLSATLRDSTVEFLNSSFPTKTLYLESSNETLILNMENSDVSELEPLGVVGIYGVNDMIGKVFVVQSSDNTMQIIRS